MAIEAKDFPELNDICSFWSISDSLCTCGISDTPQINHLFISNVNAELGIFLSKKGKKMPFHPEKLSSYLSLQKLSAKSFLTGSYPGAQVPSILGAILGSCSSLFLKSPMTVRQCFAHSWVRVNGRCSRWSLDRERTREDLEAPLRRESDRQMKAASFLLVLRSTCVVKVFKIHEEMQCLS